MIRVESNYRTVNDILAKNSGEGVFPEEYNRAANICQKDLFKLFLGSKNRTVNGQSRVVYGRNQILDKRLEPFRVRQIVNVVEGVVAVPSNCSHIRSIQTLDRQAIKRLDEDRSGMIMKDPLAKPNEDDIYYLERNKEIEILSSSIISSVVLEYLKYPTDVKYGFTLNERGRPVFNQSTTVNFEWNETEEVELTTRILQQFGIEFRDGHVQNYTNIAKSQE